MNKHIVALTLVAISGAAAFAPVRISAAPSPNAAQMKDAAFLIGTWNCTWSAGGQSGSILATFTPVMNGSWLQETEAQRNKAGDLVVTTMHYTGYDPAEKRWIHIGPDAGGGYEVAYTTDFKSFHTILPVGSDGVATFTKTSDAEWSLSEPFTQGGKAYVYTNSCKKAS